MDTHELKLMKRVKRGDRNAVAELIQRHEGYLRMIACRWARRHSRYEMEDCFQEAALGLLWAVDRFDISKGNKFLTYAVSWIKKFLFEMRYTRTAIRVQCRTHHEGLQDDIRRADSVCSLRFPVLDRNWERDIQIADARDMFKKSLKLDSKRRSLFVRNMRGQSNTELAKSRGVSQQAISKMQVESLNRVAAEMHRLHRQGDRKPPRIDFERFVPPPPYVDYEYMPLLEVVTPKNALVCS